MTKANSEWYLHASKLVFLNNFISPDRMVDQVWSVACEFQFYFVSPLILTVMTSSERPWLLPMILFAASLLCTYASILHACPKIIETMEFD